MSGSGSGGGGAAAPDHLLRLQFDWLCREGDEWQSLENMHQTMSGLINSSFGAGNPFSGASAYDGQAEFSAMDNMLRRFQQQVDLMDFDNSIVDDAVADTDFEDLDAPEVGKPEFAEAVLAYDQVQSENLLQNVLPRFSLDARDANATNGSAYVLGKALLHRSHQRDIAAYSGELHTKFALGKLDYKTKWELAKLVGRVDIRTKKYLFRYDNAGWARTVQSQLMHYGVEIERMKLTRKAEEQAQNINYRDAEFRVPFEAYQFGGNLMAAVSGGTAPVRNSSQGTTASVIGGSLQGMSVGSQVGSSFSDSSGGNYSGWGAILGGIAGAIAGS